MSDIKKVNYGEFSWERGIDRIADLVRENLNFTANDFPLAKVLEGGTWWAGRRVAKEKRADSSPPLKLDSDGTVF